MRAPSTHPYADPELAGELRFAQAGLRVARIERRQGFDLAYGELFLTLLLLEGERDAIGTRLSCEGSPLRLRLNLATSPFGSVRRAARALRSLA